MRIEGVSAKPLHALFHRINNCAVNWFFQGASHLADIGPTTWIGNTSRTKSHEGSEVNHHAKSNEYVITIEHLT